MIYFYLCYGGLKGLTLSDFDALPLYRVRKLFNRMEEQKAFEKGQIDQAKAAAGKK